MIRRAFELGWPTALVISACVGLAGANWLRLPALFLVSAIVGGAVAAALSDDVMRLVFVALTLATAGLWWGGLRTEALARSVLVTHIGEQASARVTVTGPARRSRFALRLPAETRRFGPIGVRERVELELPVGRAPPQGAVLELRARPVAPRGPETGFDERGWLAQRGIHVVLRGSHWRIVGRRGGIGGVGDRLRTHVARSLALGTEGERRALLAGIVLGADEGVSTDLKNAFRASGLYHLMAVSGQNVALVAAGMLVLGLVLGLGRLVVEAMTIGAIGAYVLAVGWQPSVVRAGVAGGLAALAWLASRPRDRWHFMALGALVLLVWTPSNLLEPGFQLSFAAVAAIFVVVPQVEKRLQGYPVPTKLAELAAVAGACGVVTAPLVWLDFGTTPVWTVPANVLAEPAMPPLLELGLLAALVEPVSPGAATALSWLAGWCAAWIAFCARFVASFPGAQTHSPLVFLLPLLAVSSALILRRLPRYRRHAVVVTAAVVICVVGYGWWAWTVHAPPRWDRPSGLRMTMLDVGQGEGILLEVPQGAVLVDSGPPEANVERQLHRMGIRALAAVVLTHPHRDHVGGAPSVLRHLRVGVVLDPAEPGNWPDEGFARRAARAAHVSLVAARSGAVYTIGRLRLRILWPDGPGLPNENPHQHCIVMVGSYGRTNVLLTGDAESDVTGRLPLPRADILKVAHHGSGDLGLPAELQRVRPKVAMISVGAHNVYGLPSAQTVHALEAFPGLRLYRTDVNGRIVVESDGRSVSVHTQR